MCFEDDREYVIKGPEYYKQLPEVSVGLQIYSKLKSAPDPEKVLFIDSITDVKVTTNEFLIKTCKLGEALKNAGYKKGDVVGLCGENSLSYFEPVVAALYLGLVVTPISFHYTPYELSHVLDISRPKIIFCSKTTSIIFIKLKEKLNFLERIIVFDGEKDQLNGVIDYDEFVKKFHGNDYKNFSPIDLDEEDLAALLSSSGTTGLPKCVMLTNKNITANMINISDPRYLKQIPNGVFLGLLPFYHAFGFHTILSHVVKYLTIVVMKKFVDVLFLSAIEKYKINILWLAPPLLVFLTKSPLVKDYDLSHIVEIVSGSAPLGKDTQKNILESLKLGRVVQGYGMTETTLAAIVMPIVNTKPKEGSCGKVLAGLSVKVTNPETGVSLQAKEVGEICFKGDVVMKGYYNNSTATKLTIDKNGWLKTGDLGYYDEDGYFYIVDRLKELIKYKGFQVAPAEVEALLLTHPKIKDAGVVGKKDTECGEICVAFVVRSDEITEDEIKEFVAHNLSRPKHLHGGVRFLNEIPRAASGKILRRILREQLNTE